MGPLTPAVGVHFEPFILLVGAARRGATPPELVVAAAAVAPIHLDL